MGRSEDGDELPLERLLPAAAPASSSRIVEEMGLWERPSEPSPRPRLLLNMIATVDGRATLGGRSGPIGDVADHQLFHALRSAVDGVLVGAGTVRTERYGRLLREESVRALRVSRGMPEEPLACIVSGRLALGDDVPLLQEPSARVVVLTASAASLPPVPAAVDYVRAGEGHLDLTAAVAELAERFSVQTLLCEGGPHLARELIAAGLLDELLLSVSPMLVGGEPSGGEALRMLAGAELDSPARLELLGVLRCSSELFLRYRVSA
jgi:riboflavin biosynthesis pyrimidine reductase